MKALSVTEIANVSGRLRLYDGTPSDRIAVTHSCRVLGVEPYIEDDNESFAAPAVLRRGASFDRALTGRFLVCPLSRAGRGAMQLVCIGSAALASSRRR